MPHSHTSLSARLRQVDGHLFCFCFFLSSFIILYLERIQRLAFLYYHPTQSLRTLASENSLHLQYNALQANSKASQL